MAWGYNNHCFLQDGNECNAILMKRKYRSWCWALIAIFMLLVAVQIWQNKNFAEILPQIVAKFPSV